MICAANQETPQYECLFLTVNIDISCSDECSYSANFEITDISITIPLESTNDECTFSNNIFDEEGLICCWSENIKCTRLIKSNNEYLQKNTFSINSEGSIINLFILSDSSTFIDIFFQKEDSKELKGYTIYKPNCEDFNFDFIVNGYDSKVIDDFVEQKTNTQYYISFTNIPSDYATLSFNYENIQEEEETKTLVRDDPYQQNTIAFWSQDDKTINDFKFKYSIIIEETYSSECTINLSVNPCYDSCLYCSKSIKESDHENHNCYEDYCKTDYYPSPSTATNCFKEEEKKLNWFLNTTKKTFQLCNTNCASCSGPNLDDCLSCYSASTKPELAYLYNNKCLNECPEGTYPSIQSEGYYLCKPCYQNCQTCNDGETYNDLNKLNNMNCLTCKKDIDTNNENKILID